MDYKTDRQKGSVKFTFTVPKSEWEEEVNSAYIKTRGKYNISGFRKGHAPRKFIENLYGPTVFFDDAFNSCASKAYGKALAENAELYPVDEPKVDIEKFGEDAVTFTIEVTLKPEVALGQYKGLVIKKAEYPVTDKDVEEDIERNLKAKSRLVEVTDREARDGDTVTIDYSGSVDGVKFNGGTAEKQELTLGSRSFIPGFEEQVAGMSIGEKKDVNVTFPDDYQVEDLKGKPAVFEVTLHSIQGKSLPELNDEFAKKMGSESMDEYRVKVKERLQKNAESRSRNETENSMVSEIAKGAKAEIPDAMIDRQEEQSLRKLEYNLMYQGIKLDDYLKYIGSTREDYKKNFEEDARNTVLQQLIVEKIIKLENITASQEEIDAKIEEQAKSVGKEAAEYKKTMDPRQIEYIDGDIKVTKLFEFLKANNEMVKEVKPV